jgi:hypothetical protein
MAKEGRRPGRWLVRLAGAVVIGVAAILVPKTRPKDHWSTTPTVDTRTERGGEAAGDPPRVT